jgi:hypothetical protein
MSKLHYFMPTGETPIVVPVRLGAGTGAANNLSVKDEGKLIKLAGESRYDLCAAGDTIEGWIYGVETATSGGYTVGGRVQDRALFVVFDGLQGTPGTGAIAVGDYVVAGTITPKGTQLASYPKVCKATDQAAAKAAPFAWRVMSLGVAGTGAVGTSGVMERVK